MRHFLGAITLMFSAAAAQGCTLPADRPHSQAFVLSQGLSTSTFVNEVTTALGDDVMGYAVVLRDPAGRIVAQIAHGYAQSPCERTGRLAFSIDTVSAWASVTKMVTTAAVLNKVRRFSSKSLTDPMTDYLPKRWQVGCDRSGDCWQDATIGHTLSYRAGFRGSINTPYSVRLQSDSTERPVGQRKYSNENFGIWNYMGAFFAQGKMDQIDDGFHGDPSLYDTVMFIGTRGIWTDYLNKRVFQPLAIRGSCSEIDFAGRNYALLYNYRTNDGADETGYKTNPRDTPNCTSGGIVMSVRDMSKFTHGLANTNIVIKKSQYEDNLERTDGLRFGWNSSLETSDGRMYFKAGGSTAGGKHLGTHIMAFTSGYTAVITTNSFPRTGTSWKRHKVIKDAYNAARAAATGIIISN